MRDFEEELETWRHQDSTTTVAQAIQRDNVEGDTLTTPDNVVEQIALVEQREPKSYCAPNEFVST